MKKFIAFMMIAVLALSVSACFGSKSDKSAIGLYFKNSETKELEATKVKYAGSQNTVDMAVFAMEHLVKGPDDKNTEPTLPEGTACLSVNVKNELATVNFSKEFTGFSGADELIARFSVVRTLCDIPGITSVKILVEGETLVSNSTGNEVGVINKKDILTDILNIESPDSTNIKLYFATSNAMALKVEERKVETQDSTSIEKIIVNELIKGPTSPELSALIPSGTKLISIETEAKSGTCFVNFSQDFVSKFAGGTGKLTVVSIVNSLCSLDNIANVQILIEGEKGVQFGEYVFNEPMSPDMSIVQSQ